MLNPKIHGWIQYYGKISCRSLKPVYYYLPHRLIRWILNKYKRFKGSKVKAAKWLRHVTVSYPNLFYHWGLGYKLVWSIGKYRLYNKSRMNWAVHSLSYVFIGYAGALSLSKYSERGLGVKSPFTYSTSCSTLLLVLRNKTFCYSMTILLEFSRNNQHRIHTKGY